MLRHRSTLRHGLAVCLSIAGLLALPAVTLAHPLGNFTINHYAGLRVSTSTILVDVVIDQAEIPAFQERQRLDTDGDGAVSDLETATARVGECERLTSQLALTVAGTASPLALTDAGLSFPPGAAGLVTMRVVCEYRATLATPLASESPIAFSDGSFAERIGWREITAVGDGVTLTGDLPAESLSQRLTAYPQSLLGQPVDRPSATLSASPGGPALPPSRVSDAFPIGLSTAPSTPEQPASALPTPAPAAAVPGGVGAEIGGLLETKDLSPLVLTLSLLAAAGLGAGHALTPGHGKTIMAAYLVGTRGSARHALGLGLSVAVSHTLGIVVLAGIVIGAGAALPPEAFQRFAPILSAVLVVGIGIWLLAGQARAWLRRRAVARALLAEAHAAHDHDHGHAHDHEHPHEHGHEGPHGHDHPHDHEAEDPHEHSHGGVRHSHAPRGGAAITWKSLFVLGLAGGIIPSTNALIILLATIATGRSVYGVVLVAAFGLGMAAVMAGIGLALVYARGWIERLPARSAIGRISTLAPVAASFVVFAVGLWLTSQALTGSAVF